MVEYGIFDTKDSVWIGTETGPLLYNDEKMARVAHTLITIQFGLEGRSEVRVYDNSAIKIRDHIHERMSLKKAWEIAEGE